ncbi:MAG TPA: LapA family protein [Candidatus Sericytochromatia bacterium]
MKNFANLVTSLIVAGWICAIAILSIQNITPISLKFLNFETIQLPVGIVLAFSVGLGLIGGAIAPVLWQLAGRQREQYYEEEDY